MDTAILVDRLYDEGKKLIQGLDEEGHKYPIALLVNFPYENEWELLLGVPHIKTTGSRTTLKTIYDIIRKKNIDLSLSDIKLEDTQGELCRNLRKTHIKTGRDLAKIPFFGNYIDGKQFPDSIIYRIRK